MFSIPQIISYWRDSLQDSELTTLELTDNNHVRVSVEALTSGRLSDQMTQILFGGVQPSSQSVAGEKSDPAPISVIVTPVVLIKDGRSRNGDRYLCPLLIPAVLSQDGRLESDDNQKRPWIPRPILEPTSSDFVIGSTDSLVTFLAENPGVSSEIAWQLRWEQTLSQGWDMLNFVTNNKWQERLEKAGYTVTGWAAIINETQLTGMSVNIQRVYESLLEGDSWPPIYQSLLRPTPPPARPTLPISEWLQPAQSHLGSFNRAFSLSSTQREALYHLFLSPENSVLAVSGPPGTGKTTLLHSVIASLWVEAALAGESPPVIVASSTNNQAVTNIIDSLSGHDEIERWLPVASYGLYLVNSKEKIAEAETRGILTLNKYGDGFPGMVERPEFIPKAVEGYLANCSRFFERPIGNVSEAVDGLQKLLQEKRDLLSFALETAYGKVDLESQLVPVQTEYGSLKNWESIRRKQYNEAKEHVTVLRELFTSWLEHLESEPTNYSLLAFIPSIKRKIENRHQLFLNRQMPDTKIEPDQKAISDHIKALLEGAKVVVEETKAQLFEVQQLLAAEISLNDRWAKFISAAGSDLAWEQLYALESEDGRSNIANLHNWLDTALRYELFVLATHYWEGRWLQTVIEDGFDRPGHREYRNEPTQRKKWRRYAMLTPCFVTTMHTGPSFIDYYNGETSPLLDYIDLLIVDEAGQVTPEVAGAMFGLAKRALVVGDAKQIEPVWSIHYDVDAGNVMKSGLIGKAADLDALQQRGLTASTGSVMQMAQAVSPFQNAEPNGAALERGMFLAEHRRSVPEIIAYCNELAYNGRLRPLRSKLDDHPWPHLGYAHIKGQATFAGGSRKNEPEARAIVEWIAENKERLEAHYGTGLDDIIGIITPFAAQKRTLWKELNKRNISLSKVGTVHALQGGERPFVIFSAVYTTKDSANYFFDRGPNMLNVAVSRAKDSFLVFGDMDIFFPNLSTPSGILARHLFADEANEITDVTIPQRSESVGDIKVFHVRTLEKHVRTLNRSFETAKRRLVIVSPFLRWRAVEADDVCRQVKAACDRGVRVDIYVDRDFNGNLALETAEKAAAALRESGAYVHVCHNIHSKLVCVDNDVFIEGSFNWLSAERSIEDYARYETSMIYTGSGAVAFIQEVLTDIQARVIQTPGG